MKLVCSAFRDGNDVINLQGDLTFVATAHQTAIPVSRKHLHPKVLGKGPAPRHVDG
jgi:hypothetical protein